ncbi:MAG: cytochrome-c peroxidase [Deltaproteobacteria bacterium]|nr:cytochrome-c peroxidase [Deltaproteobacteria bacterium]
MTGRLAFFILNLAMFLLATSPLSAQEDLLAKARQHFKPIPAKAPIIKGNPASPEKIELGKMLFFDPRLSGSGLISCNTCHNLGMGGDDNLDRSIGHGWAKGPRNAPTVLNAVFNVAQFWDGRAPDLQTQAKGPVQAGVEMANTPQRVENTLKSIPEYVSRFQKSFPEDKNPVSFDNMARAIEVFEATLITPDSPFDQFLKGRQDALSQQEKSGLGSFMKLGCVTCHNGVNIGGDDYHIFGKLNPPDPRHLPPGDKGRGGVPGSGGEDYSFRSPTLRNVALTAPYLHTGSSTDLGEVVRVMAHAQLDKTPGDSEVKDIVAFLGSLTGRQPQVEYPRLPPSTSSTPLPLGMASR